METEKQIERVAKKILGIREVMGYATKEQRGDLKGETKSVKELIREAKKNEEVSCGGFRYMKKGKTVVIMPDFKFVIRQAKKQNEAKSL